VFQSGANIRIDAQLEDLASGKVLVAETVRGTDVFAIVDQLALQIRSGVGLADAPGIRRIADVSTQSVEAYRLYAQGVDAYDHLRMQDARRLLSEAVRLDPSFASANLHLGLLTYYDGREADRQRYFAEAAKRGDRLSERQRLLLQGHLAYDAGNDAESARILDEIVARYPEFEDAYPSVLGLYAPLKVLHDSDKQLAILARGVQALPRSGMVRNMYGYALLDAGQFTRALEQFQEYARLLPHEPNPHDSLGEAHLAMLMPEKAMEHYARALAIDASFESDIGRAIALAMLGRFEVWNADRAGAYSTSAFIASRAGRYRNAAEILRTAMKRAQVNAHAIGQASGHLMSSMLALELKQFVRAQDEAAAARKVVAQLPRLRSRTSMVMADLLSGIAYARAGNVKAAHVDLQSLQARLDSNVPMERELIAALQGEIALASGDLDKAAAAFSASEPPARRWTQIFSEYPPPLGNNPPFMDGAARVAKARDDLNGAIAIYRGLLSMDPKKKWAAVVEPRYSLEIARLLEKVGDKSAASAEYERFLTLWKNADADLPELAEARRAVARFR
jgi:tetratricopeptide (TPR) repeat protein